MTTTIILILYLIIGYVVAFFCLNAYDEEAVTSNSAPKWAVWTIVTILSLLWPIMLTKYLIERK